MGSVLGVGAVGGTPNPRQTPTPPPTLVPLISLPWSLLPLHPFIAVDIGLKQSYTDYMHSKPLAAASHGHPTSCWLKQFCCLFQRPFAGHAHHAHVALTLSDRSFQPAECVPTITVLMRISSDRGPGAFKSSAVTKGVAKGFCSRLMNHIVWCAAGAAAASRNQDVADTLATPFSAAWSEVDRVAPAVTAHPRITIATTALAVAGGFAYYSRSAVLAAT